MSLYDALHRIADEAPVARPDSHEAWRSGQALRRRDRRRRAGTVLAAAAAVVLVAGLLAWLPGRDDAPVAGARADLGVPDHVYAVPDRFQVRDDESWADDEVSDDLTVGRGAAAFVTDVGLPVVVGAADGDYHLLDLPGFLGNTFDLAYSQYFPMVALSPNGRLLAYGWIDVDGRTDDRLIPSGVRILELDTGDLRTISVSGGTATLATRFAWSSDSRWLAWVGFQSTSWTGKGPTGETMDSAGRIGPDADSSSALGGYELSDGDVTIDASGATRTTAFATTVAAAPDGTLALARQGGTEVEFRAGRNGGTTTDVTSVIGGPATLSPVGWVGDGAAVVTAEPEDEQPTRLVLVGPEVAAREIGRVDGSPRGLSLATDLMSLDRPTVERPEPDWPWSTTRWVLTGLGIALVAGVAWILVVIRRRRALGGPMRGIPSAAEHAIRDDRFGPSL